MKTEPVILGVDPGTTQSAYSVFTPGNLSARVFKKADNKEILNDIAHLSCFVDFMAIEQLKAYGNASDSLFFTAMWSGRFISAWLDSVGNKKGYTLLPRKTVVAFLCGSARGNDKMVRQAIIDYFIQGKGLQGQGRIPIIGTKKSPGALFGYSGDMWAALSVAVCWHELPKADKERSLLVL